MLVRSTKCCNLENDFISCLIYSDCETYIGGLLCGIKLITLSLILKESFLKHFFFLSQLNHSFDGNNFYLFIFFFSANLEELQDEERRETKNYEDQIEDLKAKCQERQEIVNQARYVKGKPL